MSGDRNVFEFPSEEIIYFSFIFDDVKYSCHACYCNYASRYAIYTKSLIKGIHVRVSDVEWVPAYNGCKDRYFRCVDTHGYVFPAFTSLDDFFATITRTMRKLLGLHLFSWKEMTL